jgi:hypothetical protein
MNEEPKSIWKKSWKEPRYFRPWLIVVASTFLILVTLGELTGNVHGWPARWQALFETLVASLIIATVAFGLWLFIRWLFCWRNFKKFLFGLACFTTLITLFYAEENWRGKHDWEKYKHEWEAKGEKFDYVSTVPRPVPEDQNFAMAPIFDATRKLASRKWRNDHRNPNPKNGMEWDTNLVDPLQIDTGRIDDWPVTRSATNGSGDWQTAKASDLKIWQNYYRALAATTNLFPVAPQPQSPAQDVLLALGKYDSVIEELRAAGARPDSRFPLDYDDEDPAEILLPHLAALKRSSQVLQLRSLAELQNGQTEKSLDDIKLSLRLVDSVRTEPFIITHLVRIAILQITLQPVWEGLAEHRWSDAQLVELDSELSKLDFLADYELSVRGERAAHIKIIDYLEQKRSRYREFFNMGWSDQPNTMDNLWGAVEFYLMPEGWFYQNDIKLAQMHQKWNLPAVDDGQQTVSPKSINLADNIIESNNRPTPFNLFAQLLLPALGKYAQRIAYTQTSANLARVAIALERYRLAHGEYPESLDVLAPQFIAKVPHDVIGGQPLKYRRTSDPSSQSSDAASGQFVLYSVGWNERDDGGVVVFEKGSTPGVDINEGDWVWRYPAR